MMDKDNLTFGDKLYNTFHSKKYKIKSYCRICGSPIFNLDSEFGRRQLCVNCNAAYNEGISFVFEKTILSKEFLKPQQT